MEIVILILNLAVAGLLIAVLREIKKPGPPQNGRAVLMNEGKIIEKSLSQAGISIEELEAGARLNGYFNLGDIDAAILEKSGKISFLPKPMSRRLSPKDFNFAPVREGVPVQIIKNGEIIEENLEKLDLEREEIMALILSRGRRVENIILATITDSGRVDVFEKQ